MFQVRVLGKVYASYDTSRRTIVQCALSVRYPTLRYLPANSQSCRPEPDRGAVLPARPAVFSPSVRVGHWQ